jgi:pimeloyl-ACP methyl ester carboxylesterase
MYALPAKQLVQIGNRQLEYMLSGTGQPTIVLLNGSGGAVEGWHKLYPAIERLGTVLAYNRLGIGRSDRPATPQTGEAIIATLRDLLGALDLAPPYILVGHSLGGLYANLFARRFPTEVAGVVFLDAAAPGDEMLQHQHQTPVQRATKRVFGLVDKIIPANPNSEVACVPETVRQIAAAGPFPAVPLVVVTAGKHPPSLLMSAEAVAMRAANQRTLCALSPHGKQMIAANSGHFPQFTEPSVVVDAIRTVATALHPA